MRKVSFRGHSDDIVEIHGTIGDEPDEIGCFESTPIYIKVEDENGWGFYVVAVYNGCWGFGIMQLDEDEPLTFYDVSFSCDGYTVVMDIEIPDGAVISYK